MIYNDTDGKIKKHNMEEIILSVNARFKTNSPPRLLLKAGPMPWTRTLKNLDSEKPGPRNSWTLKNMDPEKHRINMGLKNMSDFGDLYFIKSMRNVICCLKVRVLTDI